jgi:hypothetical protein
MFLYFNHSAPKKRACRTIASNRAVFMASLSTIAVLSGCGSPSKPASFLQVRERRSSAPARWTRWWRRGRQRAVAQAAVKAEAAQLPVLR